MASWVKIGSVKDFETTNCIVVQIKDTEIAVFKIEERFYAIENKCSHRAAPLSEGALMGMEVRCPWHGAKFDLLSGKALCLPAREGLKVFSVRNTNNEIEIEVID